MPLVEIFFYWMASHHQLIVLGDTSGLERGSTGQRPDVDKMADSYMSRRTQNRRATNIFVKIMNISPVYSLLSPNSLIAGWFSKYNRGNCLE